jgi:hypothetical protein
MYSFLDVSIQDAMEMYGCGDQFIVETDRQKGRSVREGEDYDGL